MIETESRNPESMNLQDMSNVQIADLMNRKNIIIQKAISASLQAISDAVDAASASLKLGGRLIYMGAGTSGRLGVLDAAECVPTFNFSPDRVVGLLAGGHSAMFRSIEGAEDNAVLGKTDLRNLAVCAVDTVVGIAASGRTPYVLGGLTYANEVGASTVAVVNNSLSKIGDIAQTVIETVTGPEVLTGSTRLAAGTAQKEILNMISTISMVRIGKVYSNLMIDVRPSNEKLQERAYWIIQEVTGASDSVIDKALHEADNRVGVAIVMLRKNVSVSEAFSLLSNHTIAELI